MGDGGVNARQRQRLGDHVAAGAGGGDGARGDRGSGGGRAVLIGDGEGRQGGEENGGQTHFSSKFRDFVSV